MTRLLALVVLSTSLACRPPVTPADPPPDEPSALPDAGERSDAGAEALACPAVPITAQCDGSGVCWKNPRPLATQPLVDVWSRGCTAWAVGPGGMLLERASTGWKRHDAGYAAQGDLLALAGTDTDDVWAVGANATLLHFDGERWQALQSVFGGASYNGAWTNARHVVFVAADDGVHRFELRDGRLQQTTLLAPFSTRFSSVTGSGDTLRALGSELSRVSRQVTWTWDGRNAVREDPQPDTFFSRVITVDDRVYGAGWRSVNSSSRATFSQLFPMQAPNTTTELAIVFNGLAASAPDDFILTGRGYPSSVMHFDGFSLEPVTGAPTGEQTAVSFNGERDFFVVGERLGRVVDGKWLSESEGPTQTFTSVLSLDDAEVWLSGGFRSQAGGPFVATFTEPQRYLGDVAGVSSRALLAVERSAPGLWRFDGAAWAPLANGPTDPLQHVVTARTGESWAWSSSAVWTDFGGTWVKLVPDQNVWISDVLVLENGLALVSAVDATQTARLWACNGTRFSERPVPDTFRHLAGRGLFDFYGLTSSGDVWRNLDGTWTLVTNVAPLNVFDAAVKDDLLVMAAADGTIASWRGSRVFRQQVGAAVTFFGLGFGPSGEVLAVGTGGAVVETRH
jgi:hypothetical protein